MVLDGHPKNSNIKIVLSNNQNKKNKKNGWIKTSIFVALWYGQLLALAIKPDFMGQPYNSKSLTDLLY